jgi:hypothetical protein
MEDDQHGHISYKLDYENRQRSKGPAQTTDQKLRESALLSGFDAKQM